MIASSWRDIYDGGVKRFYNVLDDLYGNIIGYKECVMILYNGRLFPSENMFRLLYSNWIYEFQDYRMLYNMLHENIAISR